LLFVPEILNQDFARIARAHALDLQTPEMEAGNLLLEPKKRRQKNFTAGS
jgi:hypothetical protein